MKAIFNLFDFKFIFYANDYDPIHIHVIKEDIHAKFSINPVELVENNGLNQSEVK